MYLTLAAGKLDNKTRGRINNMDELFYKANIHFAYKTNETKDRFVAKTEFPQFNNNHFHSTQVAAGYCGGEFAVMDCKVVGNKIEYVLHSMNKKNQSPVTKTGEVVMDDIDKDYPHLVALETLEELINF